MTAFAIETSFKVPFFRIRTIEAPSLAEACDRALKDDNWSDSGPCYDASTEPSVTGAWPAGSEYETFSLPIPNQFEDLRKRKALQFDLLHELISEIVASHSFPLNAQFNDWLARAERVLAEANAITDSTHQPSRNGNRH